MPSASLYWHTFGSLTTALREAGFDVPVGEERLERAIAQGCQLAQGLGRLPKFGDWQAARRVDETMLTEWQVYRMFEARRGAWATFQFLIRERLVEDGAPSAPTGRSAPATERVRIARRLALARLVSLGGGSAAYIALVAAIYGETGSALWVSAAIFSSVVASVLSAPFAGWVGDRFDRRRVLITADLAAAAVSLAMAATASHAAALVVLLGVSSDRCSRRSSRRPPQRCRTSFQRPMCHARTLWSARRALPATSSGRCSGASSSGCRRDTGSRLRRRRREFRLLGGHRADDHAPVRARFGRGAPRGAGRCATARAGAVAADAGAGWDDLARRNRDRRRRVLPAFARPGRRLGRVRRNDSAARRRRPGRRRGCRASTARGTGARPRRRVCQERRRDSPLRRRRRCWPSHWSAWRSPARAAGSAMWRR